MNPRAIAIGMVLTSVLLAASGAAGAVETVDLAHSRISAFAKQLNVPVEGQFRKFSALVDVDPARPEQGRASFAIDVASFDLGSEDFNSEMRKRDWFDATGYPGASFVSTSIKPAGPGRYAVTGKLTIKGKSVDVATTVTMHVEAGLNIYEGSLPLKRLTFNIGDGEWKDTGVVADEVQVRFRIATTRR